MRCDLIEASEIESTRIEEGIESTRIEGIK